MSDHSFLPPSGAAAWSLCAMWPTMNKLFPQDNTPEALEGNAAHWVAWEMLEGRYHDIGVKAPNGIMVTEEMIEGGELVVEIVTKLHIAKIMKVEKRVDIKRVHETCFGTPDIWAYHREKFVLDVLDYKFGHRFVDEYENKQGIAYIDGILDILSAELQIPVGQLDQLITVNFTVIQPRCFYKGAPVRTWTIRADQLRGLINGLTNAANAATVFIGDVPLATTNPECNDCPGSHACAALQLGAYSDAEFAVKSVPVELSPTAAGIELRMMERSLARLSARVDGMKEQVKTYIRQGHPVAGYGTEQGYGQTKWTVPNEQVVAMGKMFGTDLSKAGVKTPNQAKDAGIDGDVIKAYSIKPPGEIKLIQVNPSDAARVFGTNN